ncbi:MAG: hypothetical protein J6C87_08275 [Bacteroides sp.]|nr:hypothetical protein [Bacteroides sp.]
MERYIKGEITQQQGVNVAVPEAVSTKFEAMKVYIASNELVKRFYFIKVNRIVEKDIKDKLLTCEKNGMITPAITCSPTAILDAGLGLITYEGKEITHETVDNNIPAIVEGATRLRAKLRALEKEQDSIAGNDEEAYVSFDFIFIFDSNITKENVVTIYNDINKYNVPTRSKDFARTAAAINYLPVLEHYNRYVIDGLIPKAASYAACGEELDKKLIASAYSNPSDKLKNINLCNYLSPIYDATMHSLGEKVNGVMKMNSALSKGVAIHKFYGKKIKEADSEERADLSRRLTKMFNELSASNLNRIKNAKADKDKKISKEEAIHLILSEILESYK